MTLLSVLGHQWRRCWRSPTLGRSLLWTLLTITAVGYIGLFLIGLGWLYPEIVAKVAPERDPLHLLNQHVFSGFVVLLGARFFLQRSVSNEVRAYLSLPIRRSKLVRVMQITSALSLFNVLPLLVLVALWTSTVVPSTSTTGAIHWAVGGLLGVASTQFVNSLLRAAWKQSTEFVIGGMIVVGGAGAGIAHLGSGISPASSWFFGELARGEILPLLVAVGATGSLAITAHWIFRRQLYEILATPDQRNSTSRVVIEPKWKQHWGPVASFAMLDAKLIFRNKQPRQALLSQLPILGVIAWQLFSSPPVEAGWVAPLLTQIFCFIISGQLGAAYHGFGYAWHGGHLESLLVRPQPLRVIVQGQYMTFAGLCIGSGILLLFSAILTRPSVLGPLGSMVLYHLGVTAPLLFTGCVWIRKRVYLNQNLVYEHELSGNLYTLITGLGFVVLMSIPTGLTLWTGFASAMWCVAVLGTLGTMVAPLWTRGVATLLRHHRHAMADSFQREE